MATIMDTIMDNMENASIRVDAATQQGSVFDVVKMVLGCDSSSANTTFRRLKEDFPELGAEGGTGCPTLSKMRINGKGQLTPVADAKTLVEIVFLLPGKIAQNPVWHSLEYLQLDPVIFFNPKGFLVTFFFFSGRHAPFLK